MTLVTHNILTETAEDSGHIDLSHASPVSVLGTVQGKDTITEIRAGALFVFKSGLEHLTYYTPEILGIEVQVTDDYHIVHIQFDTVPVQLFEKIDLFEMYTPAFLIIKVQNSKNKGLYEHGYFVAAIYERVLDRVSLICIPGNPIR